MKIKKNESFSLGLFLYRYIFVCSCVLVLLCSYVMADDISQICFQTHCFTIEIADTPEKQMKGLMFRESIPDDHGMLFIFDHDDRYAFWMKNTLIPLDIVWLDQDLKVVHIQKNVPLCKDDPCPSYSAPVLARYVLELNAGISGEIGLHVGDVFLLR